MAVMAVLLDHDNLRMSPGNRRLDDDVLGDRRAVVWITVAAIAGAASIEVAISAAEKIFNMGISCFLRSPGGPVGWPVRRSSETRLAVPR